MIMYCKFLRKDVNMLKKYSYVLKNLDCAVCAAKIENEIKKKNFIFGNNYSLIKFFIISTEKDYDKNGRPVIIINRLEDETASFKDNPIKNLYIVYKNEDDRDIDYERLLIAR